MDGKYAVMVLAGFFLVLYALFSTPVSQHYVSALADWNYMRVYTADFSSTHSMPVVVVLPLPRDDDFWAHINPDGSDIRVTVGSGSSERVLPSMLVGFDYENHTGSVAVLTDVPSTTMTFRLYYGNPHAEPVEPFAIYYSSNFYAFRKDFQKDHWTVYRYSNDTSNECYFYGTSYVYLVRSGTWKACAMKYYEEVPYAEGTLYARFYDYYSGVDGVVLWLFRDPPDDFVPRPGGYLGFDDVNESRVIPGYGVEVDVYPNSSFDPVSSDHVALIENSVTNHVAVKTYSSYYVSLYVQFKDGKYSVSYNGNSLVSDKPIPVKESFPFVVSAATGGSSGNFRLLDFYFQYAKVAPQVVISAELPTPVAPIIVVRSPQDDSVYDSHDVHFDVSVSDPNGDMNIVEVLLDDNAIVSKEESSSFTFVADVDLNDGFHSLEVVARDDEGLSNRQLINFVVDTAPPVIELNGVSFDGNDLSFDLSVSDLTLSRCYYITDVNSAGVSIPCEGEVFIPVQEGTHVFVVAEDKVGHVAVAHLVAGSDGESEASLSSGSSVSSSGYTTVARIIFGTSSDVNSIVEKELGDSTTRQASPVSLPSPAALVVGVVSVVVVLFLLVAK